MPDHKYAGFAVTVCFDVYPDKPVSQDEIMHRISGLLKYGSIMDAFSAAEMTVENFEVANAEPVMGTGGGKS